MKRMDRESQSRSVSERIEKDPQKKVTMQYNLRLFIPSLSLSLTFKMSFVMCIII